MNIHEFLGYFVPVVSVFASYLCGRLQSTHQNTSNTAREPPPESDMKVFIFLTFVHFTKDMSILAFLSILSVLNPS